MPRPARATTRRAVVSSKERILGCRLTTKEMEQAETAAKAADTTVSKWARRVLVGELNGENRDALGDLVRNMPRMPRDPDNIITCGSCGHTRMIEAKPVFVPVGMERPKPVYDDPGCPKCQPKRSLCPDCGVWFNDEDGELFSHACQGRPDHVPSGIAFQQEMTREEFARRYPREAAAAEAERRGLTPEEALDTCVTVGTGYASEILQTLRQGPLAGDDEAGSIGGPQIQGQETHGELPQSGELVDAEWRSWSSEWEAMDQMEPGEAMARFTELRAGRQLPAGFAKWPRAQMVAWLEREWSL